MDQASLVRAAFVDAGADASVEDTIEADKLREEREKAQDDAVANKRGKGRAGRGGKDKIEASAKGWGSWTGLGASTITKSNPLRGERGAGEKSHSSSATVTPSASASLILANKKAESIAAEEAKESETPAQKAARIELKRRKDAGLSGVFISEKRDRKLAMAHQAPNVPHPFPSKEAYEASMRHPLGREWNTMASTAALTKPEWTTKAGLIIQPIKPAKIVRNGKGPEAARQHIPSIGGIGKGERSNKKR
jgi:U3 small nucleolar RNA-associated protein 14